MNSSTLRRLAADHAMLRSTELPPCYLFPTSSADSSVDDLTQLTVLITGPTGPYSQGLWKLSLKIPESYPKAPPKATFRTRIWHPNVEEKTGHVCVDTLKKDWHSSLTLRDVLITIYCLLIQPNPDSALNATAGHLLQDDYESFARQARLMTSIHAKIPPELQEAAIVAKRRGETAGTPIGEDTEQRPLVRSISRMQSAPSKFHQAPEGEGPANEDEDGKFAFKENNPLLSPSPVPVASPRRPSMAKRPLSDLYIIEPEHDIIDAPFLSPSDQNVVNNGVPLASTTTSDSSRKGSQLAEIGQRVKNTVCGLEETADSGMVSADIEGRPVKRICSESGKGNTLQASGAKTLIETHAVTQVGVSSSKQGSTSRSLGTSSVKGKSRVGLRRL